MVFCYGNTWTASSTTSSAGILWMGSGGTATTTSTATSDCYMWAGEAQMLQLQQMQQMNQMHIYQMEAAAQMQQLHQYNREAQRANHELLREGMRRQEAERQPARDRAKELLLANLTPAQKETFEKNNWFVVTGGRSKREYRIRSNSAAMNIDVMDKEKVMHRLCAHLNLTCDAPLHDHILAQKLMLEAAEDDFLKIANRHAA